MNAGSPAWANRLLSVSHPHCYYWSQDRSPGETPEIRPALLAKVTDLEGTLTGLHRTWLDPRTARKAPLDPHRKAMGLLHGHGVRIGTASGILAAGEGIETLLSLGIALPDLPIVAAFSAAHLAALILPPGLTRLYIAVDADSAGRAASDKFAERAGVQGIETVRLFPRLGDFNDDLLTLDLADFRAQLRPQLAPEDVDRLLPSPVR